MLPENWCAQTTFLFFNLLIIIYLLSIKLYSKLCRIFWKNLQNIWICHLKVFEENCKWQIQVSCCCQENQCPHKIFVYFFLNHYKNNFEHETSLNCKEGSAISDLFINPFHQKWHIWQYCTDTMIYPVDKTAIPFEIFTPYVTDTNASHRKYIKGSFTYSVSRVSWAEKFDTKVIATQKKNIKAELQGCVYF